MESWPVFLCYRQSDGERAARIVFEALRGRVLQRTENGEDRSCELDVYFDKSAPAVSDWTALHEGYLVRARSFIIVCTPGACLNEGADDWVHREIDWWLANRAAPPILIEAVGEGGRYVPRQVAARWPRIQRIPLDVDAWPKVEGPERTAAEQQLLAPILGGILDSGTSVYREELEREKARADALKNALARNKWLVRGLLAVGVVLAVLGGLAYWQRQVAEAARRSAELHLREALIKEAVLQCSSLELGARSAGLDALKRAAPLGAKGDAPATPVAAALAARTKGAESAALASAAARCLAHVNVTEIKGSDPRCKGEEKLAWMDRERVAKIRAGKHDVEVIWRDSKPRGQSELTVQSLGGKTSRVISMLSDTLIAIAFHPTQRWLATSVMERGVDGSMGQIIRIDPMDPGLPVGRVVLEENVSQWRNRPEPGVLRFSVSGQYLIGGGVAGRVRVWQEDGFRFPGRRPVFEQKVFAGSAMAVALNPEEDMVASIASDGLLEVWPLHRGPQLVRARIQGTYGKLDWPESSLICVGSQAYRVERPVVATVAQPPAFHEPSVVTELIWADSEALLMLHTPQHGTNLVERFPHWHVNPRARADWSRELAGVNPHPGVDAQDLARNSEGKLFAMGREAHTMVRACDLPNCTERWTTQQPGTHFQAKLAMSTDGTKIVSRMSSKSLLLDTATGKTSLEFEEPTKNRTFFAGDRLVALDQQTLATRDVVSGTWSGPLRPAGRVASFGRGGPVTSKDGHLLSIGAGVSDTDPIQIWNLSSGRMTAQLGSVGGFDSARFAPQNERLVIAADGSLTAFRTSDGSRLSELRMNVVLFDFLTSENVVIVDADGQVFLWNTGRSDAETRARLEGWQPSFVPREMALTKQGLVALLDDGKVTFWSSDSGRKKFEAPLPTGMHHSSFLVDPDGKMLIVRSNSSPAVVWDFENGKVVLKKSMDDSETSCLSANARHAGFLSEQAFQVYDVLGGKPAFERKLSAKSACFSVASSGISALCKFQEVELLSSSGETLTVYRTGEADPVAVAFSSDAKVIAVADSASNVALYDTTVATTTRLVVRTPPGQGTGGGHGANLVEVGVGQLFSLPALAAKPTELAFSKSGRWLAVGDEQGRAHLWDLDAIRTTVKGMPSAAK